MKLTLKQLCTELELWSRKHGKGRDEKGLRFGQFIWWKYNDDMKELFPDPDAGTDGFNDEIPLNAFNKISPKLR